MLEEVREIINKRKSLNDEDDYNIEECRNNLINQLSQNVEKTVFILNQLEADDILFVSEVFEEISSNLQSLVYINCLKNIAQKFPNIQLQSSIEVAEEYMD